MKSRKRRLENIESFQGSDGRYICLAAPHSPGFFLNGSSIMMSYFELNIFKDNGYPNESLFKSEFLLTMLTMLI
jgi:hypothetical protein